MSASESEDEEEQRPLRRTEQGAPPPWEFLVGSRARAAALLLLVFMAAALGALGPRSLFHGSGARGWEAESAVPPAWSPPPDERNGGATGVTVMGCLAQAKRDAEAYAARVAAVLPGDEAWPGLREAFKASYTMNVNRFVTESGDGTNSTFAVTGDIEAMWLRDSAAQFHVYIGLARESRCVRALLEGLVRRQAEMVLQDPYANSFHREPKFEDLKLGRGGYVFTRNYEVDSLAYFVRLAYMLWVGTGSEAGFTDVFDAAARRVIVLWRKEQRHEWSTYTYPELSNDGKGPSAAFTGMTWNAFRPSDDPCQFSYHVAANLMAAESLRQLAEVFRRVYGDLQDARTAETLAAEIDEGVQAHAVQERPGWGTVYAYEVDGMGGVNWMDDANVPSLLSLPYLLHRPRSASEVMPFPAPRAMPDDGGVYNRTRRMVLSHSGNKFFFAGTKAEGVGSPHTRGRNVWPLAVIMRGLTATDPAERRQALRWSLDTRAGNMLQHESFDPNDPTRYTRPDFGWPNALLAELVLQMHENGDFAAGKGSLG